LSLFVSCDLAISNSGSIGGLSCGDISHGLSNVSGVLSLSGVSLGLGCKCCG
jgi:hypothetical protein